MKRLAFFLILLAAPLAGQDRKQPTNSLFDDYEMKTFAPASLAVQGEVENPGPVDLNSLPLRGAAIKELGIENGKQVFKGSFFVSGYALCDVLNGKKPKKVPENTFGPLVDMYVIVENEKGEKAVFSWGEIYHRDSSDILITRTEQPVYPARAKTTWPLPNGPRLVCGGDLLNRRFIGNPTRITVKSYSGAAPAAKPKDIYAPQIILATRAGATKIGDIDGAVERRNCTSVLFGHGMGFKEVLSLRGYVLRDLIAGKAGWAPENSNSVFVVVSAKDGYRSVFSGSEVMNRNDQQDLLLNDLGDTPNGGRYTLIVPGDFFADRDVRSVEKIELVSINP
jgi:hypothetical protein